MEIVCFSSFTIKFFSRCSHLITVPSGVSPVNALSGSPIMFSSANLGGTLGGGGDFGGINPDEDPELAMVLRLSAEEARATEEARLRSQEVCSRS